MALLIAAILLAPRADARASDDYIGRSAEFDPAIIEARIAAFENATEPEARLREQAVAALRQALSAGSTLVSQQEDERRFDELLATGRAQIDAARERARIAERAAAAAPEVPTRTDARTLRATVEQTKADLATISATLGNVRRDLASEVQQPSAIRSAIVEAQATSSALRRELDAVNTDDELLAALREARALSLRARLEASRATIARLQKELLAQPIRQELLQAQRRALVAEQRQAEARLAALEAALTRAQRADMLRAIADAGIEVPEEASGDPAVLQLRNANVATAERLTELGDRAEAARRERDLASAQATELATAFEQAQRRLAMAGSNDVLGRILLAQRRTLPSGDAQRGRADRREAMVRDAGLRSIELEEELAALRDREAYRSTLPAAPRDAEPAIQRTVDALLDGREALLQRTLEANARYLDALAEVAFEEEDLQRAAGEFEALLSRRLLWIRTRDVVSRKSLAALPGEFAALLDPSWWWSAGRGLGSALLQPTALLGFVAALWLRVARRRLRASLDRTAEGLHKPSQDSIGRTFRALGFTTLLALPLPLLLSTVGVAATQLPVTDGAVQALGRSIASLTPIVLVLLLIRSASLRGGLFEAHLRWERPALARLRGAVDLLWPTFLLPAFLNRVAVEQREGTVGGELERLLLVLLLAGLAVFLHRLLRPSVGIALELRTRNRSVSGDRQRSWSWLALGPTVPLILAGTALYGFLFTAQQLLTSVIYTLGLLGLLVLAQELIQRWLLVARRRIELQQILRRRAALAQTDSSEAAVAIADEEDLDLTSLDKDTRALVRTLVVLTGGAAIFLVWSELLPALTVLDDVTLWRTSADTAPGEPLRPVTGSDALLALLVGFLTFVGARTVPSLLEIVLRQQATMAPGSRVAFATLSRYGIVVLGTFALLSLLGASWARLQWLVAALGVGIGFGLQEIIANFISGLIILVERPIRVGDVVSVGEVEGTVTRIEIRATTITNWDRKEHLVPNREFITGRVLNWSLSDEVTRLTIPVGVAYGSDVHRAREVMLACAADHPAVVGDPAPFFYMADFGNDALMLELRCHVPHISDRLQTMTELREAIYTRFGEAGITIAFPQRDVHLDTKGPLEILLQQGEGRATTAGPNDRNA